MIINIVKQSKKLMREQTVKNGAPAWALTELAVAKGKELAKKYKVDEKIVMTSLYLAHTVFNQNKNSKIRKNHTNLSADFALKKLKSWNVSNNDQKIIANAIQAHHASVPTTSLIAEVVKNAECFKFVTLRGGLIFLHDLGRRGYSYKQAVTYVLEKMNEKIKYLTFREWIKEAEKNKKIIIDIFSV